jgi:hypothetical protein
MPDPDPGTNTNTAATSGLATQEQIHAVTVKPIPFSRQHCDAWFQIMESQFELANVTTSSTKFFHTLSALTPEVVALLPDTILTSRDYD